jgi:hypothetical protein
MLRPCDHHETGPPAALAISPVLRGNGGYAAITELR